MNSQNHYLYLDDSVYEWLGKQLYSQKHFPSADDVKEMLITQRGTTFLLVWPIMERKLFKKKLEGKELRKSSEQYKDLFSIINKDGSIDTMIEYFHNRFSGKKNKKFQSLSNNSKIPKELNAFIAPVLSIAEISDVDKLHYMLYITHRYRNNIFHGNKFFPNWCNVSQELDYCITFMMRLVDAYQQKMDNTLCSE